MIKDWSVKDKVLSHLKKTITASLGGSNQLLSASGSVWGSGRGFSTWKAKLNHTGNLLHDNLEQVPQTKNLQQCFWALDCWKVHWGWHSELIYSSSHKAINICLWNDKFCHWEIVYSGDGFLVMQVCGPYTLTFLMYWYCEWYKLMYQWAQLDLPIIWKSSGLHLSFWHSFCLLIFVLLGSNSRS